MRRVHARYGSNLRTQVEAVLLEGIILVPVQTDRVIVLQDLSLWSDLERHVMYAPESTIQRQNVRDRT